MATTPIDLRALIGNAFALPNGLVAAQALVGDAFSTILDRTNTPPVEPATPPEEEAVSAEPERPDEQREPAAEPAASTEPEDDAPGDAPPAEQAEPSAGLAAPILVVLPAETAPSPGQGGDTPARSGASPSGSGTQTASAAPDAPRQADARLTAGASAGASVRTETQVVSQPTANLSVNATAAQEAVTAPAPQQGDVRSAGTAAQAADLARIAAASAAAPAGEAKRQPGEAATTRAAPGSDTSVALARGPVAQAQDAPAKGAPQQPQPGSANPARAADSETSAQPRNARYDTVDGSARAFRADDGRIDLASDAGKPASDASSQRPPQPIVQNTSPQTAGGDTPAPQAAQQAARPDLIAPLVVVRPEASRPAAPGVAAADEGRPASIQQTAELASIEAKAAAPARAAKAARQLAQPGRPAAQPAAEQVAVQIRQGIKAGADRLHIRLQPPELGRVEVRLEISHDQRSIAVVTAEKPETLDLLQRDSRTLHQALQDAGLKMESSDLTFRQGGGNEGDGGAKGRASGQDRGAGGEATRQASDADDEARPRRAAHTGALDIEA